ncbi:response regulator transcription factor [bacterium]|nr:response regulator transcription factor [bacterium]
MTTEAFAAPVRILLADDHAILRTGLKLMLSNVPNLEVVAEATDGTMALQLAETHRPDLVIMDITMPGMNGIEATYELKRRFPAIKVLMLTMHENEEVLFRTVQAGAAGYVLKKSADNELLDAIHQVMAGETFLRPEMAKQVIRDYLDRVDAGEEAQSYETLTEREQEVLKFLAEGLTNKQVAEKLVLSVRTVETHRMRIMDKLALKGRAALVAYAKRRGLVL